MLQRRERSSTHLALSPPLKTHADPGSSSKGAIHSNPELLCTVIACTENGAAAGFRRNECMLALWS